MKNKKNMYILLPAVILVWSLLGYRIFSAIKPTNDSVQRVTSTTFKPTSIREAASFTINTNYRDPFLGTIAQKNVSTSKKNTKKIAKQSIKPFPNIIYKGLVSAKGKNRVFLIAINGQQFFFKNHSTHEQVKLIRGNSKEVILKFHEQQQTFSIIK